MAKNSTRQHLIEAATRLFCRSAPQTVSVNDILAEAGVARMTLYKHFRSKNELMLAVQRQHDEAFRLWFHGAVHARARRPSDRLLAMFDVIDDWLGGTQTDKPPGPALDGAAEHKRLLLSYIARTASQARAKDPEQLARDLMLLLEGAIATAALGGDPKSGRRAKQIAARLIGASCPEPLPA